MAAAISFSAATQSEDYRSRRGKLDPFGGLYVLPPMATALLIAAAAQVASTPCPASTMRSATLEQTQAAWLARFNALDLPCFLRFFAADATLFSPGPIDERTRRVDAAELHSYRGKMFARLDEGRTALTIQPRDVMIARLGPSAAIVSFHLSEDAANPGRRTLVWRRERERVGASSTSMAPVSRPRLRRDKAS